MKTPKSVVMDRQQVRWALLKISLLVLAGTTWIFISFVFATRPEEEDMHTNALVSLVRLPASLPAQLPGKLPKLLTNHTKPIEPIRMDIVKLPCWDISGLAEQPVAARWVRLTGRPCQTAAVPESIEVSNLSNGYMGTVFMAQENDLTTDFIPMQEGANDILIRFGHEQGVAFENRFVFVKAAGE